MNITDKELVLKCQNNGDLKAFELLIKRHQDKVRSVIYKFISDPEELNDVSQESFIKAFKSIKTFKGNASISTWFCSIAVNTCKDRLRSKKIYSEKVINIDDQTIKEIPSNYYEAFEDSLILSEDQRLVFREIQSLPEEQKLAIILHDVEDFTYEDVAKLLQCPLGTVKSRLFNARKRLKEKLKPFITSLNLN